MNNTINKDKRKRKKKQYTSSSNSNTSNSGFKRRSGGARNRKKQKESTLDTSLLVKKAVPQKDISYTPERQVQDLPIDKALIANLLKKGFTHPTEIQDKCIDHLLEGRDLLGIAKTGTGKTAAFLVPVIHRALQSPNSVKTLVLVPTRELALQVEEEFKSITKGLNLFSACFIGGANINNDFKALRRSTDLVVATPGRLLDLAKRKKIRLSEFNVLILDEFDRMLDMGFSKDVKQITDHVGNREQTLLFSATIDRKQKSLIDDLLDNPVEIKVSTGGVTADHVEQGTVKVEDGEDKFEVLLEMMNRPGFEKVLIFDETKRGVSKLTGKLSKAGISSDQIHGDKTQNYRQKALNKFKLGRIKVLVATDVAARGIDVSDITHVVNYRIPQTYDSYIHRIGRTGRAGKAGHAYTFIN